MTLTKKDDGIYLDGTISIQDFDSIVFDCDGVLIDVTKSYDQTIIKTTTYMLKNFANVIDAIPVTSEIIEDFKKTGGFNDEVDLTYAVILSLTTANKLNTDGAEFISQVIENADQNGIESVENYLDTVSVDISEIKTKLDYPGRHSENLLYSIFDQLFYGPVLYQKLFERKSQFTEPGFIEYDDVIVTIDLIDKLRKKFGDKISIVTGRGIASIRYSLKQLLDQFNLENSVFLEDESRKLAKPNPQSLLRVIHGLNSTHCLFVGDSMEDFIMSQKSNESGNKTTFCGIIGTSKNPEEKKQFFEDKGAKIILNSIQDIPKALNLEYGQV